MGSRKVRLRWLLWAMSAVVSILWAGPQATRAESIVLLGPGSAVEAGSTFSALVILADNTTNLVSYSLDVDVVPDAGAMGSVTGLGNPPSNFFDVRNLIEQDPDDSLDPSFSLIAASADGGVFFNALSASGQGVDLALPGVSDVLGQVFFAVSAGAVGTYQITLGPGTGLFDGQQQVPFDATTLTVQVIPEPTTLVMLVGGMLVMLTRGGRSKFGRFGTETNTARDARSGRSRIIEG